MKIITFDPLRTLGIPGITYIKPEQIFQHCETVRDADWLLYPEYWQVNFLVYGWKKRIFPNINSYHLGHDKVEMTRALWAVCPQNVPRTEILSNNKNNLQLILEKFSFPFIAKEVRSSQGNGIYLINSPADLKAYASENSILYVQELLPIYRDLRVVFLGKEIISAYWREGVPGTLLNNVARGGRIVFDAVPKAALDLVEKTARALGINHAGFDLAEVDGHFYFLEFNVLFGTQGLLKQGINLGKIILKYLEECTPTLPIPPKAPVNGPPYLKNKKIS